MAVVEAALDPAWIALIGTIFGGVGLKMAEHWLGKNRVKTDDASKIRDELRLQITAQKEEIRDLEEQVDKWRSDYYALRDKYSELQTELTLAVAQIKSRAEEARVVSEALDKQPPPTVD